MNRIFITLLLALPLFSLTATADDNYVELLTNGACDGTFNGWVASTGRWQEWAIATEDDGTYSWVSSFMVCTLEQTIDLAEKNISTASIDNGEVWLKASAEMRSSQMCNGMGARTARVVVKMLDAEDKILKTESFVDYLRWLVPWTTFNSFFQLAPGTRKLIVTIEGEDSAGWDGNYGPRFRNVSLTPIDSSIAPDNYMELLTNGTCNGTSDGWQTSTGEEKEWAITEEDDGTYSWIAPNEHGTLEQTIDLADTNISAASIDNGGVWLKASAQMRSSQKSEGEMGAFLASAAVEMFDANDNIIGAEGLFGDERYFENWTTFTKHILVAPGTRKLRYVVDGEALEWDEGPRFRNLSLAIPKDAFYSRADVNRDDKINTTDVVGIYSYIEQGDASGITRAWADANRDTQVNTTDVVAVYDIIINGEPQELPAGALPYPFSIHADYTVLFAKGNLQYVDGNWQFAAHQYEYFGTDQSADHKDMFPYFEYICPEGWFCLSNEEWTYLLSQRTVSNSLIDGALYTLATLGGQYKGMIVFPDEYNHPADADFTPGTDNNGTGFSATVSLEGWALMEKAGAMFLPCAGYKSHGETWKGVDVQGCYMTTSPTGVNYYDPWFGSDFVSLTETSNQNTWSSVRLAR